MAFSRWFSRTREARIDRAGERRDREIAHRDEQWRLPVLERLGAQLHNVERAAGSMARVTNRAGVHLYGRGSALWCVLVRGCVSSPTEHGTDERHSHGLRATPSPIGLYEPLEHQSAAAADAEVGLAAVLAVLGRLRAWESFERDGRVLLGDLAAALGLQAGTLWLAQKGALVARAIWTAPGVDGTALERALCPLRLAPGVGLAGCAWRCRALVDEAMSVAGDAFRPRYYLPADLHAAFALPALAAGHVLAVFELYSTSRVELGGSVRLALSALGQELGRFFARRRGELGLSVLTARELEVLNLITLGLNNDEIAERLAIGHATVKTHLEHVYSKLGVPNRASAVTYALRAGFIE
jgi:DNA-binding CsgD family transcriptional regulator